MTPSHSPHPDTKHTPGPWQVTLLQHGPSVTRAGKPRDLITHMVGRRADARLIAAAPDMLEALRDVVRVANMQDPDECVELTPDVMAHIRAAIRKATGDDA